VNRDRDHTPDFKRTLDAQKGKLYRDVEIKLLTNGDATAGRIVDELSWIESAALVFGPTRRFERQSSKSAAP
jgi:hypothetical protein